MDLPDFDLDDEPRTSGSRFLKSLSHIKEFMRDKHEDKSRELISSNLGTTSLKIPENKIHKQDIIEGRGGIIPGHLSSPITSEDQEAILNYNPKNLRCFRHRLWKEIRQENDLKGHIYNNTCGCLPHVCVPELVKSVAEGVREKNSRRFTKLRLMDTYNIALKSLAMKEYNFLRAAREIIGSFDEYYAKVIERYSLTDEEVIRLIPLYEDKIDSELTKDLICNKKILTGYGRLPHKDLFYDKDTCVFFCRSHRSTLLAPTTLLINILDNMQSRFSINLSWMLSDKERKYGGFSIYSEGNRIWECLRNVRDNKKVAKFYDFLGKWEALVIGYIIKGDGDEGCHSLYNEIMGDLSGRMKYIVETELLPKTYNIDELRMFLEIIGISKSFGHPCIDMKVSLNVVREYGGKHIFVNPSAMDMVTAKIIEIFCTQYFHRHHRYPPTENDGTKINKIMITENRPFARHDHLTYKDFLGIRFKKTFDFDYSFDTSSFIKDTAISPDLSCWGSSFDYCAYRELYNKESPKHKYDFNQTRVVLNYLGGNKNDIRQKVNEIEAGYWNEEHLMCSYCRKERENKDDGRVYVKQCYCQRLVQVLREHNISTFIFPYFDDQTMTNSETQVLKKQEILSQSGVKGNNIIINIDLSKWNLHFRDDSVRPVGAWLNQIFGMKNFFSDVHRWFLLCRIFCNSRLCPPDYDPSTGEPIPGPFYINNHKGGGEGMCQKLWTLINIGVIRLTADQQNVLIDIMGQGDNQVLLLKLRDDQLPNRERIRADFMQALEWNFDSIGLKLKLQETWYSRRLFEYGKQRYLDGIAISTLTKRVARLIPDINDGITSIQSCFAQINTTTEGCCKTEYTCSIAYILNQFETLNYLRRIGVTSHRDTDNDIEKFLYFPTILGGYPSSLYYNHAVRGNDDPLPQWICLLQDLYLYRRDLYKKVIRCVDFNSMPNKNYQQLFTDIRSLNVRTLLSTESFVKESTYEFLATNRKIVTNPEITVLFDPTQTIPLEELVQNLQTMRPMFLPLAHELLRLSNAGVLLALQNKLTNVSTITKVVSELTEYDFHNHSVFLQRMIVYKLKTRLMTNGREVLNYIEGLSCPTRLGTFLRELHWDIDLLAPTKPTQNHQFKLGELDHQVPWCKAKSIIVTVSDIFRKVGDICLMPKGPSDSYIGNKTREKLIDPIIKLTNRPSEVVCYQSLYTIKSWCQQLGSNHLEKLVDVLLSEKHINLPQELQEVEDELFCPTIKGGNIVHRLKAAIEKRVGIRNTNPSIGSHFSFSTNSMSYYLKGGKDYTLHFQNAYHSAEAIITHLKLLGFDIKSQYYYTVVCDHCTEDVTNCTIDLVAPHSFTEFQQRESPNRPLDIIDTKEMGDENELRRYMSVVIGKIVGKQFDLSSYKSYYSCESDNLTETGRLTDISTYFIKTLDFEWFLCGFIYESNLMRNLIIDLGPERLSSYETDSLKKFCSMLIEAERSVDMMLWLGQKTEGHWDILEGRNMSEVLVKGLIKHYKENEKSYFMKLFLNIFRNESLHKLHTVISWCYKRQRTILNKEDYIIRLNPKKRTYNYPALGLTLEESLQRKTKELEYATFYTLVSNINPRYYEIHRFDSNTILPAYKAVNTLEKYDQGKMSDVKIQCFANPINYSVSHINSFLRTLSIARGTDAGRVYKIPFLQHLGRPMGSISTAASKYYEVLVLMRITNILKPDLSVHLAEGSGSVAWLFSNLFDCYFSYNTLMSPEIDNRKHQYLRIPPACSGANGYCLHKLLYRDLFSSGETDITKKDFLEKIKGPLHLHKRIYMTIDAESTRGDNNFGILLEYVQIFLTHPNIKLLLCKILTGDNIVWLRNLHEELREQLWGYEWAIVKPTTSHPCNSELIVCIIRQDDFPTEVGTSVRELRSIFNSDILSLYPVPGFSYDILRSYLSSIKHYKSYLESTILSLNPHLRYHHKITSMKEDGLICGVICKRLININTDIYHLITSRLRPTTELSMDLLTRLRGVRPLIRSIYLQQVYSLLMCFSEDDTITAQELIMFTKIGIIEERGGQRRPSLWFESQERPDDADLYLLYELEDVKNFYRENYKCYCEDKVKFSHTVGELLLLLLCYSRFPNDIDLINTFDWSGQILPTLSSLTQSSRFCLSTPDFQNKISILSTRLETVLSIRRDNIIAYFNENN